MAEQGVDIEQRRAAPCVERQGSRARGSLPPLSIGRRGLHEWPAAAPDDAGSQCFSAPATPGQRRQKAGPDTKLDLAFAPPMEPDFQQKRDEFAFYKKICSRVANYHIYLGSDAVAKNKETLKAHGITHILNCVGFVCPEYFKGDFFYKTLWLRDSPGEDITSLLYDVFDYFEEVRELGGQVFVHCCQGISRSTSFVIAYMMWRECRSFEEAFQDVKASRGVTNPNMGFACQLLQCQKRVHAAPMSPTSVLRMYRVAPYSPYDPLHLVPKAVSNPTASSLDSRGAFVIHMPSAIFVWIGCNCDAKIAQAAKVGALQVVRYERAQGAVHVIIEGTETNDFWDSLVKYSDLFDDGDSQELNANEHEVGKQKKSFVQAQFERVGKVCPGKRIVSSYSPDFELYQRAKEGGVVPPLPSTGADMLGAPTRIPEREDRWSLLRRKFFLGDLFSVREMDVYDSSPASSMANSSPLFSPFSSTTTSSDSNSVSASPLSYLSVLSSPATPSPDSKALLEGANMQSSTARDWAFQSSIDRRTVCPSVPPCLASINENDKEAESGLMDCFDETGTKPESGDAEMVDASSVSETSSRCSWEVVLEAGNPVYYTWPSFEQLDKITVDHFKSDKEVFLLLVPQQASNGDNSVIYVWVGRDLHDQEGNVDSTWQQAGLHFLQHLRYPADILIKVVKHGCEPEELLSLTSK